MAMVLREHPHPLMPRKRTDSDTILACSSAAKEAHSHTGVVAVRCVPDVASP